MPAANDFGDLGRIEDSFNSYLDALARGESRAADDVDPTLAETAVRVHAMAARTNAEIEMMRNVWSTVQVGAGGYAAAAMPAMGIPGRKRSVSWTGERKRNRSWRFANHAAMAAVLVVALVTGYFGLQGGLPNGGSDQNTGALVPNNASTPTAPGCDVEPRTVEEIASLVDTPTAVPDGVDEITTLPDEPDAETVAGVQETQQLLNACGEDPLRAYALYSDSCLRETWIHRDEGGISSAKLEQVLSDLVAQMDEKRATAAAMATPDADIDRVMPVILAEDIEMLSDGRVGAIVRLAHTNGDQELVAQDVSYVFFVNVDGQWLFDCDAPAGRA
jgi:hypothetical protein